MGNFDTLLPEEIVVTIQKYRDQFQTKAHNFLVKNLQQMNLDEALKIWLLVEDKQEKVIGAFLDSSLT